MSIEMNVFVCPNKTTVEKAPVGLFFLPDSGEVICISEYKTTKGRSCTIVSSGENYCGGDKEGYPIKID